jgi:hypothetical protein
VISTQATPRATRGIVAVAVLLLCIVLAACSPTASPSPSAIATTTPTASPTAVATPGPSAAPSVAPSPAASSAAADPAQGLKISAPYTLIALDPALEASFRQQFAASVGSFGSLILLGGREAVKDGALAGYVLVIGFPSGIMSDAVYQQMLQGMTSSSNVTFVKTTVSGTEVSSGATGTAGLGVYRAGDNVVITITPTVANLGAITTALVTAN